MKASHTLRGCVDWNLCCSSSLFASILSHPSWVCGLKPIPELDSIGMQTSHPSWVCGLKPVSFYLNSVNKLSHPSWVCGLKLLVPVLLLVVLLVTPFVGVWIETLEYLTSFHKGASHPSWVCGLKPCQMRITLNCPSVTPFVGVWIETSMQ